jgi:hypothetical protein
LRGFARGARVTAALLRRTAFGIVTPSSSDTARKRLAVRLAGCFFLVGCTGVRYAILIPNVSKSIGL